MEFKRGMLVTFLVVGFLIGNFVSSSMDLEINVMNNSTVITKIYLRTNDSSNSGLDSNDLVFLSPPNNYTVFYSNISNDKLIVDSWNPSQDTNRELELVLLSDELDFSGMKLEWNSSKIEEHLTLTLKEYSSGGTEVKRSILNENNQYTLNGTEKKITFGLETSYNPPKPGTSSGGSSSGSSPQQISISDNSLREGYKRFTRINDTLLFRVDEENHSLRLLDILNNSIRILISSEPKEYLVTLGETKKINVDEDNSYDIEVSYLAKNSYLYASLLIKEIDEQIISDLDKDGNEQKDNGTSQDGQGDNSNGAIPYWRYLIALVIIIGGVGFIYLIFRSSKTNLIREIENVKTLVRKSEESLVKKDFNKAKEIYNIARKSYQDNNLMRVDKDKQVYNSLLKIAKKLS